MSRHRLTRWIAAAVLAASAGTSCVERNETITIAPDGAVVIELEYKGSEEELSRGDAMPSADTGWEVVRTKEKGGDDAEYALKSKRRFEPGEPLPSGFAAPDDPDADLYLEFPTTLRMERRRDGIYYYFNRVYTPRRWAYVRHWQDEFIDDNIKKLGEKPVEELTAKEQSEIVGAFASVEAFKQLEFTGAALLESNPDLPVEHRLMARRALLDYYERISDSEDGEESQVDRVLARCQPLDEDQRNNCFDQETKRILAEAYDTYVQSLQRDAALTPWQVAAFEQAYARAEKYYKITDQLGGHVFEIEVAMPGTIIAHSALDDEVEVDREKNVSKVRFTFKGDWFRDRPCEIIAVSRLERDSQRR